MVDLQINNLWKMLKSGKEFEFITEKIAALQTELEFLGSAGLLNLNKHCEGFVQGLLNIVNDLKLENLNKNVSNFPGLDLGDRQSKIAYQVTSESGTDKIEDALEKLIRYKHYETFTDIRFFLLRKKQKSYPISTAFPAGFVFDPKSQIFNFSDLLKTIQNLPAGKITEIYEFVEEQTAPTIAKLKSTSQNSPKSYLIDTADSLEHSGMSQSEHWVCKMGIRSINITAPSLYKKLNEYFTGRRREYMRILHPTFQKSFDHSQIVFHQPVRNTGVMNHFHEFALKISDNNLQFEFAQYREGDTLLTNLNQEMGACLSLLYFLNFISNRKELNIEVDIDLACNVKLAFFPQSSPFSVDYSFSVHYLKPGPFSISTVINSLDDENLTELMERIIHGFIAEKGESFNDFANPFLSINENQQKQVFATFRTIFG